MEHNTALPHQARKKKGADNNTSFQNRIFILIFTMGAYKHQYTVCIHTPPCTIHTLPPNPRTTHNPPTKLPHPHTLTIPSTHTDNPHNHMLALKAASPTTLSKLPYKATSKAKIRSKNEEPAAASVATHTPQTHKKQGKHINLHLPTNTHPKYTTTKAHKYTPHNLTCKIATPPPLLPSCNHTHAPPKLDLDSTPQKTNPNSPTRLQDSHHNPRSPNSPFNHSQTTPQFTRILA